MQVTVYLAQNKNQKTENQISVFLCYINAPSMTMPKINIPQNTLSTPAIKYFNTVVESNVLAYDILGKFFIYTIGIDFGV